jgi:uncharacterized protein DUF1761
MQPVDINLWAVLAAAGASFVIGTLWYSPVLFVKPWLRAMGKTTSNFKPSYSIGIVVVPILGALLVAYVLANIIQYAEADTLRTGALTGFWVWLGFMAPVVAVTNFFEQRSPKLTLITAGNRLVELIVMGAILATWQ